MLLVFQNEWLDEEIRLWIAGTKSPSEAASKSESESCARVHDKTGIGKRKRRRNQGRARRPIGCLVGSGFAGRWSLVAGRWSLNSHNSTGVGGEVGRQTSRGEDLQEDDVAEGGEVPKNQVANLVDRAEEKDERSGGRKKG